MYGRDTLTIYLEPSVFSGTSGTGTYEDYYKLTNSTPIDFTMHFYPFRKCDTVFSSFLYFIVHSKPSSPHFIKINEVNIVDGVEVLTPIDFAVCEDDGATHYIVFNLTKYYLRSPHGVNLNLRITVKSGTIYLSKPTQNHFYLPPLVTEYASPFALIEKQEYLSSKLDDSLSYSLNVVNGYNTIRKELLNDVLPYPLFLSYDEFDYSEYLFMPKRFKLSFQETISVGNDIMTYTDGSYFRHELRKTPLSNPYYYEENGSGLLAKQNNDGTYQIFTERSSAYKLFNSDGFLIKIVDDNGQEINIAYDLETVGTVLLQMTVTDYFGNVVKIYNDTSNKNILVCIYEQNQSTPEYTYSLRYNSNNILTSINENGRGYTYFHYDSTLVTLLSWINEYSKYRLLLTRNDDQKITAIRERYNNKTISYHQLVYSIKKTEVTDRFGVTNRYVYDDEGQITTSLEVNDADINIHRYEIKNLAYRINGSIKNIKGVLFRESTPTTRVLNDSSITVTIPIYKSFNGGISTLKSGKTYLAFLDIYREGETMLSNKEDCIDVTAYFNPDYSPSLAIPLGVFPYKEDDNYSASVFVFKPSMTTAVTNYYLKVKFNAEKINSMSVRVNGIYIFEYRECEQEINQIITHSPFSADDAPKFIGFAHNGCVYTKFYFEDFVSNYMNKKYGKPFFWINKKKEMITFTNNYPSSYKYSDSISDELLEEFLEAHGDYLYDDLETAYNNMSNLDISTTIFGKKNIEKLVKDSSVSSGSYPIYSISYLIGYNNSYTIYNRHFLKDENSLSFSDYNLNNQLINEQDHENNFVSYSYNTSGNLLSRSFGYASIPSISIAETATYDSYQRLKKETSLIDNQTYETNHSYSNNYLSANTFTDGRNNVESFTYSSDYLKLTKISKGTSDVENVYAGEEITSLKDNNNIFKFERDSNDDFTHHFSILTSTGTYQEMMTVSVVFNTNNKKVTYTHPSSFYEEEWFDRYGNLYQRVNSSETTKYLYFDENPGVLDAITSSLAYTSKAKLYKIIDGNCNNRYYIFDYQEDGLLTSYQYKGFLGAFIYVNISYSYDVYSRLESKSYPSGDLSFNYTYQYKDNFSSNLKKVLLSISNNNDVSDINELFTQDSYKRPNLIKSTFPNKVLRKNFNYRTVSNKTTTYPYRIDEYEDNNVYVDSTYLEYDGNSNITRIKKGNKTTSDDSTGYQFIYDVNDRLTEEKIFDSSSLQGRYIYTYDNNGNIASVAKRNLNGNLISTDTYSYHPVYKNLLISFNNTPITYNNCHNPTSLPYGSGTISLTWTRGTMLESITKTNESFTYSYNHIGLRMSKSKIVNNETVQTNEYFYDESNQLIKEKITLSGNDTQTTTLSFIYGISGVIGFCIDGTIYQYKKNIFGDVEAIYQGSTLVGKYIYDAYGKHVVVNSNGNIITDPTNAALINPIRYRSYYYDNETGFYYCKSRYYYPLIRRWISPDPFAYLDNSQIDGLNLFAYCNNNPVMYVDEDGNLSLVSILIGAFIGFAASALKDYADDGKMFNKRNCWRDYLGATVGGAIGAIGNSLLSVALFSGLGSSAEGLINGNTKSIGDFLKDFGVGAIIGSLCYGVTATIKHFGNQKVISIIGSSKKHVLINKNLAKNGFASLKVGKLGYNKLFKRLYRHFGYNVAEGTWEIASDIISSFIPWW